jgi:hypothetical protein
MMGISKNIDELFGGQNPEQKYLAELTERDISLLSCLAGVFSGVYRVPVEKRQMMLDAIESGLEDEANRAFLFAMYYCGDNAEDVVDLLRRFEELLEE